MGQMRGFVMADPMIALMLVSLLLVSLLGMNRNSSLLAAKSESRFAAVMVAQSVLEDADQKESVGEVVIDDEVYRWELVVTDVTNADRRRLKLEKILVTVSWSESQSVRQVELQTARVRGLS